MIYSFELNDEETKIVEDYMRDIGETSLSALMKRLVVEDVAESREGDRLWEEFIAKEKAEEAEKARKEKEIEA